MRIVLISLAAAASALAVASPAAAQWAPPPQPYGYASQHYGAPAHGAPGYGAPGHGFGYGYGHVRALQVRIDTIQRQIRFLDSRNVLSNREARRLREQSRAVEHRLVHAARHGLSPWEGRDIESRIARLEYRVHREAMDRNGRMGDYAGRNDDRWEHQHDRWHDRHDD